MLHRMKQPTVFTQQESPSLDMPNDSVHPHGHTMALPVDDVLDNVILLSLKQCINAEILPSIGRQENPIFPVHIKGDRKFQPAPILPGYLVTKQV